MTAQPDLQKLMANAVADVTNEPKTNPIVMEFFQSVFSV